MLYTTDKQDIMNLIGTWKRLYWERMSGWLKITSRVTVSFCLVRIFSGRTPASYFIRCMLTYRLAGFSRGAYQVRILAGMLQTVLVISITGHGWRTYEIARAIIDWLTAQG